MQDELGNVVQDGDFVAFIPKGMVCGPIVWVNGGGLSLSNGQQSPAFVNVVVQVVADPVTGKLPNVHKIFGPPAPPLDPGTNTKLEEVHG